jgi:antagonist of KipI
MRLQKLGISSSIQDLGRAGNFESGLNSNGALDVFALKKLNLILGNLPSEAAIECLYPTAEIVFEENGVLAISGSDSGAFMNSQILLLNKQYAFNEGDILRFKKKNSGNVVYIGFKGGIDLPVFENSKSSSSVLNINVLEKNVELKLKNPNALIDFNFGISGPRKHTDNLFSIVFNKNFLEKENQIFLNNVAEILLESNRMGIRLKLQNKVEIYKKTYVSSFVCPGSVQILPNGDAIILMADAQVTGGYPVIGFVSNVDLGRLAQVSIGQKIKFESISIEKASQKMIDQEKELDLIAKNIHLWKSIVT